MNKKKERIEEIEENKYKVKGIVLVNTKIFNEYLEMCEEDI